MGEAALWRKKRKNAAGESHFLKEKKEQETRYYILLFRFVLFLRIVSSGSDDRRGIIPDTASTQLCVYTFIHVYVYRGI